VTFPFRKIENFAFYKGKVEKLKFFEILENTTLAHSHGPGVRTRVTCAISRLKTDFLCKNTPRNTSINMTKPNSKRAKNVQRIQNSLFLRKPSRVRGPESSSLPLLMSIWGCGEHSWQVFELSCHFYGRKWAFFRLFGGNKSPKFKRLPVKGRG